MSFWIILTAVASLAVLVGAPRWAPTRLRAVLIGLMVLVAIGALGLRVFELQRWQLTPLYVIAALALLIGALQLRRGAPPARGRLRRTMGVLGGVLLVAIAVLPTAAFPVFSFPAPSGPNPVGVTDFLLVDAARADPFRSRPSGRREIMIRAWYPAADASRPTVPYMSRRTVDALVGGQLPVFLFGHLPLVATSSHDRAPLAAAPRRYPVIVFVPGFRSFVSQSTALAQELASRGFVVLSLGAPGDASAVEFPDGQVVPFKRDALLNDRAGVEAMSAAIEERDPARHRRLIEATLRGMPNADQALRLQTADVRFLLGALGSGKTGTPLDGRLDPSRIGVMGMSLGGAVAGQVCLDDRRCRAGANLDGFQFGDLLDRPIGVPFLMLSHDYRGLPLNRDMYRGPNGGGSRSVLVDLIVPGSRHLDFTDLTLFSPLLKSGPENPILGPTPGPEMLSTVSRLVVAFFDEHLNGRSGAVRAALQTVRVRPAAPAARNVGR